MRIVAACSTPKAIKRLDLLERLTPLLVLVVVHAGTIAPG